MARQLQKTTNQEIQEELALIERQHPEHVIVKKSIVDSFAKSHKWSHSTVWGWLAPGTHKKPPALFLDYIREYSSEFLVPAIHASSLNQAVAKYDAMLALGGLTVDRQKLVGFIKEYLDSHGFGYSQQTIEGWMLPSKSHSMVPRQSRTGIEGLVKSGNTEFSKVPHAQNVQRELVDRVVADRGFKSLNALCDALSALTGIPQTSLRHQIYDEGRGIDKPAYDLIKKWASGMPLDEAIMRAHTQVSKAAARQAVASIMAQNGFRSLNQTYNYISGIIGISQINLSQSLREPKISADLYLKISQIAQKAGPLADSNTLQAATGQKNQETAPISHEYTEDLEPERTDALSNKINRLMAQYSGGRKISLYKLEKELGEHDPHVNSDNVNWLLLGKAKALRDSEVYYDVHSYMQEIMGVLHKVSHDGYDPNVSLDALIEVFGSRNWPEDTSKQLKHLAGYMEKHSAKVSLSTVEKFQKMERRIKYYKE